MAEVRGVIAASIAFGSRFQVCGSMSANTGVQRSQEMMLAVAMNVNGVVMISPVRSSARIAICIAQVPFERQTMSGTPSRAHNSRSSLCIIGPLWVMTPVRQISSRYATNSGRGARAGWVT